MAKKIKVKLDGETLKAIWDASKPNVERNKKKYTRKNKYKTNTNTNG
jgi:hypothetical protein